MQSERTNASLKVSTVYGLDNAMAILEKNTQTRILDLELSDHTELVPVFKVLSFLPHLKDLRVKTRKIAAQYCPWELNGTISFYNNPCLKNLSLELKGMPSCSLQLLEEALINSSIENLSLASMRMGENEFSLSIEEKSHLANILYSIIKNNQNILSLQVLFPNYTSDYTNLSQQNLSFDLNMIVPNTQTSLAAVLLENRENRKNRQDEFIAIAMVICNAVWQKKNPFHQFPVGLLIKILTYSSLNGTGKTLEEIEPCITLVNKNMQKRQLLKTKDRKKCTWWNQSIFYHDHEITVFKKREKPAKKQSVSLKRNTKK